MFPLLAPLLLFAAFLSAAIEALTSFCKAATSFASACPAGVPPTGVEPTTAPVACATLCTKTFILCSMMVCTASLSFTNVSHRTFNSDACEDASFDPFNRSIYNNTPLAH